MNLLNSIRVDIANPKVIWIVPQSSYDGFKKLGFDMSQFVVSKPLRREEVIPEKKTKCFWRGIKL